MPAAYWGHDQPRLSRTKSLETSTGMANADRPANTAASDFEVEEDVASTLRALGYLD